MNTSLTHTRIKPIQAITGKSNIPSGLSIERKTRMIKNKINPSRYEFLGFLDRSNDAILRERFYNVRDDRGRFAPIAE
jgi:hypothetical protein